MTALKTRYLALSFLLALAAAQQVHAQVPARRPAVSPYLNLNRQGTNPAINYYGLVRPQIDFRNSIQNLQTQVNTAEQQIAAETPYTADLPPTGQRAQFMSHGTYFFNSGTTTTGTPASRFGSPQAPPRRR